MDFSQPRTIAEYGPGEGVHSRELAARMDAGSNCSSSNSIPLFRATSSGSLPTIREST